MRKCLNSSRTNIESCLCIDILVLAENRSLVEKEQSTVPMIYIITGCLLHCVRLASNCSSKYAELLAIVRHALSGVYDVYYV